MKFIALGGQPATGKTTVMRQFMADLGPSKFVVYGTLQGLSFTSNGLFITVLGVYAPGEIFAGTDRLSMAVSTDAKGYIEYLTKHPELYPNPVLVFEGDRLFNGKFLDFCKGYGEVHACILTVSDPTLQARRDARKHKPSETFLKGRRTKYANLTASYPLVRNESKEDASVIVNWMRECAEKFK